MAALQEHSTFGAWVQVPLVPFLSSGAKSADDIFTRLNAVVYYFMTLTLASDFEVWDQKLMTLPELADLKAAVGVDGLMGC